MAKIERANRILLFRALVLALISLIVSADVCPDMTSSGMPTTLIAEAKRIQLRLAVGNRADSMLVSWNSPNTTVHDAVQVQLCSAGKAAPVVFKGTTTPGNDKCYTVGSNVHQAEIFGLLQTTRYFYRVGMETTWSSWMSFQTPAEKSDAVHTFVVIGDLGVTFGGPVTRAVADEVDAEGIEMVIHNGDIGYADMEIEPSNGTRYQDFLDFHYENSSSFAARVPYMLMPGNHEASCDYQEYYRRAVRPNMDDNKEYYSFTRGHAHFIMLSAERGQLNGKDDDPQTVWLRHELETSLQMKRTGVINWLFTFVHYPRQPFGYCSYNLPFCKAAMSATEEMFEDLFVSHEVDIHFAAHQHVYERTYPVRRQEPVFPNATIPSPHPGMFPTPTRDVFDDPPYPVYLVNGAAGDDVVFPPSWLPAPPWSVANSRSVQFGYSFIKVAQDHVNVSYRVPLEAFPGVQKVYSMDEFTIVKTAHGQSRKRTILESLSSNAAQILV